MNNEVKTKYFKSDNSLAEQILSKKIRVAIDIEGRWRSRCVVDMTQEKYDEFCACLDDYPRGDRIQELAHEIMIDAKISIEDGGINNLQINYFEKVKSK